MNNQFPPIIINILTPLFHLSFENLVFKKEFEKKNKNKKIEKNLSF